MLPSPQDSFRHVVVHFPGLPLSTPSSHSSRATPPTTSLLIWPSPQNARLHVARQSSSSAVLLSSHSSPCSRTPLPHVTVWQVLEQVLPGLPLSAPLSQSSTPFWGDPSPQKAILHEPGAVLLLTHASVGSSLWSSHSSPGSRMPLPHFWRWQSLQWK